MKKILISIIMLTFVINFIIGCNEKVENVIYQPGVELTVVYSDGINNKIVETFVNSLNEVRGENVVIKTESSSKNEYEIVLGYTSREVSKNAYRRLSSVHRENSQYFNYIIYCESNCVAIAYEEDQFKTDFVINKAVSSFLKKYATGKSLKLDKGVIEKGSVNIVEEQRKMDEIKRKSDWINFENQLKEKVNANKAKSITNALQQLYGNIDTNVVTWLANLYDINAGFYYSNSGRDNLQFGPDIESTQQALNLLKSTGMISGNIRNSLPETMVDNIGLWVKSLQDPNGYFYHPQWTKEDVDSHLSRRARDLSKAMDVLDMCGYKPTYNTPLGDIGDGIKINRYSYMAFDCNINESENIVKIATSNIEHLKTVENFKNYLSSLDILESSQASYSIGNQLSSQIGQIKARDKIIGTTKNPTPLTDALIDWLNSKQNSTNGLWIKSSSSLDFNAINGAFKIISIYSSTSRECHNVNKIINACLNLIDQPKEDFKTVVYLYNIWATIDMAIRNAKLFENLNNELNETIETIYLNADEYIQKSTEIIKLFIKDDGSCSYSQNKTSATSQGLPVALPNTNEGDVNATSINLFSVANYICRVLNVSKVKPFSEAERMQFILEISTLKPIVKK